MIYEITDETFEADVVRSPLPCVIEFTAGWCTLCDEMVPTLEALSEEFEGRIRFCIANIDEQRRLRIRFAVAAVPYLVYVANGEKTPLFDEIVSAERLRERLQFMLDGGEAPTTRPL